MNVVFQYDFLHVLYSARKFPAKNYYFSNHILFSTISLLHEQRLNPSKYSKKKIIMGIFLWATDHDINMHEKIQNMNMYRYL
jgi:hypothetical protein